MLKGLRLLIFAHNFRRFWILKCLPRCHWWQNGGSKENSWRITPQKRLRHGKRLVSFVRSRRCRTTRIKRLIFSSLCWEIATGIYDCFDGCFKLWVVDTGSCAVNMFKHRWFLFIQTRIVHICCTQFLSSHRIQRCFTPRITENLAFCQIPYLIFENLMLLANRTTQSVAEITDSASLWVLLHLL
jgi:hypothetical protein